MVLEGLDVLECLDVLEVLEDLSGSKCGPMTWRLAHIARHVKSAINSRNDGTCFDDDDGDVAGERCGVRVPTALSGVLWQFWHEHASSHSAPA